MPCQYSWILALYQPRLQQLRQLRFQHILIHPNTIRILCIVERSIYNCMCHLRIVLNGFSEDSCLPFKFFQRFLRQDLVKILLKLIKSTNKIHSDICFQHFKPVDFHGCIVKPHFLIGFLRKTFILYILCCFPAVRINVHFGYSLFRLRNRDSLCFCISCIKSIYFFLDLIHHVHIDLLDLFRIFGFIPNILLSLFFFPILPVRPAVHPPHLRTSAYLRLFPASFLPLYPFCPSPQ